MIETSNGYNPSINGHPFLQCPASQPSPPRHSRCWSLKMTLTPRPNARRSAGGSERTRTWVKGGFR